MRWTLLIAILAIPCLLASAEDSEKPEVKLPYAIERAEKSLIRDADKALKAYNDAIEKAAAKYSNVLDSELKRAMRDGDLDLANKINDKKAMIECVKQAAADMQAITLEKRDVSDKSKSNSTRLTIVEAKYGVNDKWLDATDYIRGKIVDNAINASISDIHLVVGSPIRGVKKKVVITYRIGKDKPKTVEYPEGDTVLINVSKD